MTEQQQMPVPTSDMLVVRRTANPDGSSRPVFTIVRKPSVSSSATAAAPEASQPSTTATATLSSLSSAGAQEDSNSGADIYGESFWIDDMGCDPIMDVAPGLAGSYRLAHLQRRIIDSGRVGQGLSASSGRQSRLPVQSSVRKGVSSGSTTMTPLPTPISPKLAASSDQFSSTKVPPKMLQCSKCGKHFRNLYSLEHHICAPRRKQLSRQQVQQQEVNGIRYYLCPACSKPFKWIGNLTRHFHTHTGGRFFRCEICGKSFFTSYQVKRHMNSHLGVRYKCTICAKPFTCKYSCHLHIRQHMLSQHRSNSGSREQQTGALLLTGDHHEIDMDDLEDADSIVDEEEDINPSLPRGLIKVTAATAALCTASE
uniref:Zinc finger protein n=1 Tax=Macrostomum lignano TaxID=282301 RepID=A0A1I8FS14_9PLAT